MLGHQREDDIVEDYCDSRHAKGHPLFSKNNSALQIRCIMKRPRYATQLDTNKPNTNLVLIAWM